MSNSVKTETVPPYLTAGNHPLGARGVGLDNAARNLESAIGDCLDSPNKAVRDATWVRLSQLSRCMGEAMERVCPFAGDEPMTSPDLVRELVKRRIGHLEYEVFLVLFLSNKHNLIASEELSRGTIDGASVYPREVVKRALAHNAGAVILAHNHPSGDFEPSQADRKITDRLKAALDTVGVRVLDHQVVTCHQVASFAERGWV